MSRLSAPAVAAFAAVVMAISAPAAFADSGHAHNGATPQPTPSIESSSRPVTDSADPMAGMDHSQPMAGMDHGAAPADAASPTTGHSADTSASHSHPGSDVPEEARPRALVIGGFAALNGAVVIAAGFMRRRARLTDRPARPSRSAR